MHWASWAERAPASDDGRGCVCHVLAQKAPFDQAAEAKALDRLGDPEWLGAAVGQDLRRAPRGTRPRAIARWR
ncbi:hypothetical protein GCM10010383_55600 [Streptomyces lomondensis]|uniref:Uncharacterized protein n=1 Tax=Streptomyces lomondensis TaxID=68229 RepID=A0ABQ2XIH3_9ACTN|nr:hypothetical protein GCM10010383_55600 [Streptomyces lomondensis]